MASDQLGKSTKAPPARRYPRPCRVCGRMIEARSIVYGRSKVKEMWAVHVDTNQVPCAK